MTELELAKENIVKRGFLDLDVDPSLDLEQAIIQLKLSLIHI